ncbi:MAG TPA: CBS domain-containing protein, partial [Armatimonadota bacterium]|nr:CBS domain-containing protein [Armatimonadota bacterium]
VRAPADLDPDAITRVIVVDTCSRSRLGPAAAWLELPDVEVYLYDHHPGEACDLHPDWKRVAKSGSVSSILAAELRERGIVPSPVEATTLLLGIYEDTGSLLYAGTTPEDVEAAAWLLRQGGDLDVVSEYTRRALSPEHRRLLRELLAGVDVREIRGVPVAIASAPPGPFVEGIASLANRVMEAEEVPVALLLAPMDGAVYVIGRSSADSVDLGAVLRELGGGGHPRAASAAVRDGCVAKLRERLIHILEQHVAPEPTAREIMSSPVRTIDPDVPITEARRRMIRYGHSGLVVVEDGRLAGIVTRRDVDKARHHRLEHSPVSSVMTRGVRTVSPDAPLSQIEEKMIEGGVGRLPVLRRDEELIGIVTRTDVLRALHG